MLKPMIIGLASCLNVAFFVTSDHVFADQSTDLANKILSNKFVLSTGNLGSLNLGLVKTTLQNVNSEENYVTRGAQEVEVYRKRAPSVVLVVTNDGIGSGSLIDGKGHILTSWHVIEGYSEVGVIFKPSTEGQELKASDLILAKVIKFDEVTDLALLKALDFPTKAKPIPFGKMEDVMVGADVHAIGHPTGGAWTYTRGFISQIRKSYEWVTESGVKHKSDIIQTQTPINPGNSGGPLLNANGDLIGVNSFKASGEALNFAVSVGQISGFLKSTENRYGEKIDTSSGNQNTCPSEIIEEFEDKENESFVQLIDIDCDGEVDLRYIKPNDKSLPETLEIDSTGDGRIDTVIYDQDRNGNPDFSIYDIDADGHPDLKGYYREGEFEPYRVEKYSP